MKGRKEREGDGTGMSRIPFLSDRILHFQSMNITLHPRMDGGMDESMSMTTAAGGRVAFSHVTTLAC